MANSFYSCDELKQLGFKSIGHNVSISKFAQFYGTEKIDIGSNIRIDDFCILSGDITLGSHIHISAHCCLYGSKKIVMEDFSGLSPRTTIFSASDDFSGNYLIGPTIPSKYTSVTGGPVVIEKFAQVGSGCIIFPNVIIHEGAAIGSMSLVNRDIEAWSIYAGIPAKFIKQRTKEMITKAQDFLFHYFKVD